MAANTPQNYQTLGQAPLDAKLIFTNKEAFDNYVKDNSTYAFNFYKGMKVYFQEEEKMYIWENPFSDNYKENEKLMTINYIYPQGADYEGLDYSGKAFNLIELPYKIENLGVWTKDDDELTVEVVIFEGSTVNPFDVNQIYELWPDAERIAFVSGDITGLKLFGQNIQLFQEFPAEDWDNLSYEIWNSATNFVQNAKIKIALPGEVVDYTTYQLNQKGNSFKEIAIVHSVSEMNNKNSIFFRPVGNTFEIHVIDKLKVRRSFVSQQQGITDIELAFSGNILQILDLDGNIITSIPVEISNVNQLQSNLNSKLPKPSGNMLAPDADFKFLVLVDEFGESRRILASYFDSSAGVGNIIGTVNEIRIFDEENGVLRVALDQNVVMPGNLTVMGNLTVKGDTTVIETEELKVNDNIITLNSNVLPPQVPVANSGIEISRGVENNTYILYNETVDRWQFSNDGTTFHNIPIPSEYSNASRSYATTITSINAVVNHPLQTMDVKVELYDTATGTTINSNIQRLNNSQVQVEALVDYTAPIRVLMVKVG